LVSQLFQMMINEFCFLPVGFSFSDCYHRIMKCRFSVFQSVTDVILLWCIYFHKCSMTAFQPMSLLNLKNFCKLSCFWPKQYVWSTYWSFSDRVGISRVFREFWLLVRNGIRDQLLSTEVLIAAGVLLLLSHSIQCLYLIWCNNYVFSLTLKILLPKVINKWFHLFYYLKHKSSLI
jgi:hypothetical protein